uniref:Uncharacterized protein n=1 Tax=viral metagenome TaxID=1070528 RepID=A0A6C0H395_9ZZZZ
MKQNLNLTPKSCKVATDGAKGPKCPADTEGMNAQDACKKVKEKTDQLGDFAHDLAYLNPATAFSNVLGLLGSHSKSDQSLVTTIKNVQSSVSSAKQQSECDQSTNINQSNSITGGVSAKCLKGLGQFLTKDTIAEIIHNSKISNISQANSANAENICKINLVLKALTKMDASIDNSALQAAVNKAQGLLSGSDSNQDICNNISTSETACKYIQQSQCCAQQITENQSNFIDGGCLGASITNVVQTNTADAHNQCVLDAQASVSDTLSTKIKNTTQQSAENSSEGLTMNFMIVIIIIFLLIVGTPVVFGGYIGKKVFLYIGTILLIAALALVAVFFITTQKEQIQYNSPFSACVGTKTFQKDFIRCKYGDLKTRVQDDDIIGYDFFIDIPDGGDPTKIEPSKIQDTQLGSAVYITVAPDAGAACTKETPVSSASVSYIKKRQKYIFLVIAAFLFVAGMGILIYGLLKPTPKKVAEKAGHRKNEIAMKEINKKIAPYQTSAEYANVDEHKLTEKD